VAVAFVRTVKTASNATAVQIVYSNRRGSRDIEHIGSAHSPQEVEALKAVARQRLHANQDSFDFGDGRPEGEALPITSTRSRHLWDALCLAYTGLGLDTACTHDEVFQALVLDRVIEPVKLDTIRVLDEIGIVAPSYRTIVLLALHAGSVEVFGSCRCPYDLTFITLADFRVECGAG
jgi:hypothetical protein